MEITTATTNDIPELAELLGILFSQEREFIPDPALQKNGIAAILRNPDRGVILTARDDRRILGMLCLLFSISTALGGPVGTIEDVVVRPAHRGAGIGTALLREAVKRADQAKLLRLSLLTDPSNHRAISFYQTHGFSRSEMLTLRRFPS